MAFILVLCVLHAGNSHKADAAATLRKEFEYTVYWAGIIAGKAVMTYETAPESIKITTRVKSSGFISLFYKVDDVSESILSPDGYPISNMIKIREGRKRRHKVTIFERPEDSRPHKATFRDLLKNITMEYDLDRPTYDILSAFYALSKRSLDIGTSEYLDIFDNKKLYNTEVKVLRKERVTVHNAEFDTIVIKPLLKSEGIFVRKGDMYIWLSDDDRRLPVMIKSKVKIGHFTAKLKKDG